MKYIKRFNEEVSYTYGNDMVFLKGLEDDIEGIFVQVLDKKVKYNESNSEGLNEEEVRDFCETHLVYLLDDGLRVLVSRDYKVTLSFRLVANNRWGQIKDQFISFLTHLRNEYHFLSNRPDRFDSYNLEFNIIPEGYGSYPDFFNIDDIISEKIVPAGRLKDDYKILSIQFKIKGKK